MPEILGQMWRDNDELEAEFGLDALALMDEVRRLERKVNLSYQMARHFDGNSRVRQANGTLFPRTNVDDAWETAGRMLKGVLDDGA